MEGIVFTRAAIYEKENPTRGNGSKELSSLIHHSAFFTEPSRQCVSKPVNYKTTVAQRGSLIEHIMALLSENVRTISSSDKVRRNDEKVATLQTSSPAEAWMCRRAYLIESAR
ncbi:MAG: hypothetical protein AAB072_03505 [Nitrospirota bacterium]